MKVHHISSYIIAIFIITFLSGCSSNKYILYNPKIPASHLNEVYKKDYSNCRMKAYDVIKAPKRESSSYSARGKSDMKYSSTPNLAGSLMAGYESARNSPANLYRESIKDYTYSCLKQKGYKWLKEEIK